MGTNVTEYETSQAVVWFKESVELHKRFADIIEKEFTHGVHYGPAFPGAKKNSLLLNGAERARLHYGITIKGETSDSFLPDGSREFITKGGAYYKGEPIIEGMSRRTSTKEPKFKEASADQLEIMSWKRFFCSIIRYACALSDRYTDEVDEESTAGKRKRQEPPTKMEPPQGVDIQGMKSQIWDYCLAESDGIEEKAQRKLFEISTGANNSFPGVTDINDKDFNDKRAQYVYNLIFRKRQ